MRLVKRLFESEKFRYLLIGGLTTLVNLVVFHLFLEILHRSVTFSNVVSIIVAILFAFAANKVVVFRAKSSGIRAVASEFVKFIGGRAATMAVEVGGVYLFNSVIGTGAMFAKIITQAVVIILNYFISKYVVFRHV